MQRSLPSNVRGRGPPHIASEMQIRLWMAISAHRVEVSTGQQVEASAMLLHCEVQHHPRPISYTNVRILITDALCVKVKYLYVLFGS